MVKRKQKLRQSVLPFRQRGGARKGAGRKPKGEKAGVSHRVREAVSARYPVHVTVRLVQGLPNLRRRPVERVLRAAFVKACERLGFRLTHYSVQGNHLHLICEAKDRRALARGMQGLLIRVAKALNKLWGRSGTVFADRYHHRVLKTPRQVRNALAYVLNNARRHGIQLKEIIDRFSSSPWFDGWKQKLTIPNLDQFAAPVARAHSWLLKEGWRRHRLISPFEVPGG